MDDSKNFHIIIFSLSFLVVFLVVSNVVVVNHFKERQENLTEQLLDSRIEEEHYRKAYDIVLEDVKIFSSLFNAGYHAETSGFADEGSDEVGVITLSKNDPWSFYAREGFIKESCFETTKLVQGPLEIMVVASSEGATLRLLVNAQDIAHFDVVGAEQIFKVQVDAPKGTHYIDVVYDGGAPIDIFLMRVGDRTVDTTLSLLDFGSGFGVFDCKNTTRGSSLDRPGALRMRVELV